VVLALAASFQSSPRRDKPDGGAKRTSLGQELTQGAPPRCATLGFVVSPPLPAHRPDPRPPAVPAATPHTPQTSIRFPLAFLLVSIGTCGQAPCSSNNLFRRKARFVKQSEKFSEKPRRLPETRILRSRSLETAAAPAERGVGPNPKYSGNSWWRGLLVILAVVARLKLVWLELFVQAIREAQE